MVGWLVFERRGDKLQAVRGFVVEAGGGGAKVWWEGEGLVIERGGVLKVGVDVEGLGVVL